MFNAFFQLMKVNGEWGLELSMCKNNKKHIRITPYNLCTIFQDF